MEKEPLQSRIKPWKHSPLQPLLSEDGRKPSLHRQRYVPWRFSQRPLGQMAGFRHSLISGDNGQREFTVVKRTLGHVGLYCHQMVHSKPFHLLANAASLTITGATLGLMTRQTGHTLVGAHGVLTQLTRAGFGI